jgi:hypothetical protein
MPWGRLDDSFYDHPKLDLLGRNRLACVGLHALAISWCNRFLTDGQVPRARVRRLGGTVELADCLVKAGLWERSEGGNYRIHDFGDYNESADYVRTKRRQMRELGRRGGERSGEARRFNRGASTDNEAERLNSRPVHTLPIRTHGTDALQKEAPRRDPELERIYEHQAAVLRREGQDG